MKKGRKKKKSRLTERACGLFLHCALTTGGSLLSAETSEDFPAVQAMLSEIP